MNKKVTITFISDTHTRHNYLDVIMSKLPVTDVIVHSGDASFNGTYGEMYYFFEWYGKLPYKHKVFVAGNHDWGLEYTTKYIDTRLQLMEAARHFGITILDGSEVTVNGYKFWGTPIQKPFCGWAFNRTDPEREMEYRGIPDDVDVLITHGPPLGILDWSHYANESVGDPILMNHVIRSKPIINCFGHIHGGYGTTEYNGTTFVNASVVNERYVVTNDPIQLSIEDGKVDFIK